MRIHIDDTGTPLTPELRGWLAERLEAMNTPTAEIFEARVTCGVPQPHQRLSTQMQVEFLLAGQTLCVVQAGATLTEATQAVLHAIGQQLRAVSPQRRGRPQSRKGAERTGAPAPEVQQGRRVPTAMELQRVRRLSLPETMPMANPS